MLDPIQNNAKSGRESLRASIIMLCFGLGILAFLVAIERPEWFHIRPVSGTAAAMAHAATLDAAEGDRLARASAAR